MTWSVWGVSNWALWMDSDATKWSICKEGYALDKSSSWVSDWGSGYTIMPKANSLTLPATKTNNILKIWGACTDDCKECYNSGANWLLWLDSTKFVNSIGACNTNWGSGFVPLDGRWVSWGDNVATWKIDPTTKKIAISTWSNSYYLDSTGKTCVTVDQCGVGYYGFNGNWVSWDASWSEWKDTATFWTKWADPALLASIDGTWKTKATDVTCRIGYFKDQKGNWIKCDESCNLQVGWTGPGNNNWLDCKLGYYVASTNSDVSPVTYKCTLSCPPLSGLTKISSKTFCTLWDAKLPVLDLSTTTCISDSDNWPSGTIKTTLDKMSSIDNKLIKLSTVSPSLVKIWAPWDPRWATWLDSNPNMCLTCSSGFKATAVTTTINSISVGYAKWGKDCPIGSYNDSGDNCASWPLNWNECSSLSLCSKWLSGFYLSITVLGTSDCVSMTGCPTGTYADALTGKCQLWISPCETCTGSANNWLTCVESYSFLSELGKWYATCPSGTYSSGSNWLPCQNNVNLWDSSGQNLSTSISWDSSCKRCAYNSNYCISCATGKIKASQGRWVDICPDDTTLDTTGSQPECKSWAIGCLKCILETSNCPKGSSAKSFSSNPTSSLPKWIRWNKNQGFYLFRGVWVKTWPVGTYPDKLTGWWAKCDCNWGKGGCIDRYTCSNWPLNKMNVDLQTGRCMWNAGLSYIWALDWKSFTISISSLKVKFRDLDAEKANASYNQLKLWRIGNEGSMYDSDTSQSTVTDSFVSMRCGEEANTKAEINYILSQFKSMTTDYSISTDYLVGGTQSTSSFPGYSQKLSGPLLSSEPTVSNGVFQTSGQAKSSSSSSSKQVTIAKDATSCPNQKEIISIENLGNYGISSISDTYIQKYIQGMGILFGDIDDSDISSYQSPKDGLAFTSNPTNL